MSTMSRLRLLADTIHVEGNLSNSSNKLPLSGTMIDKATVSETHSTPSANHGHHGSDSGEWQKPSIIGIESVLDSQTSNDRNSGLESSKHRSTPVEISLSPTISSSGSTTSSVRPNIFLKLQRQRLQNERIRSSLEEEIENFEWLKKEENTLRQKVSRSHEVIQNLREQSESLESTYTGMEKLYRTNAEKLKILQQALTNIQKQWQQDSAQFNMYSGQLKKLQQRLPDLTNELARVADQSTNVANCLIEKISQPETTDEDRVSRQFFTSATQTNFDMNTISELESIRKQVSNQRIMMKQVRETVELLRRCP